MIALVSGGASAGKSSYAERLALSLAGPHWYIATMRHGDEETEERIRRHRRTRAGKGFVTIEMSVSPSGQFGPQGTVLLEDLPNMLMNGLEGEIERVFSCDNVVVVTNEIGSDSIAYEAYTQDFIKRLGAVACDIAARADLVIEVEAGIPNVVKARRGARQFILR